MKLLSLAGYTLYRFFSDARRVFALVLLLVLNLAAFRAFDASGVPADSGEIFGEGSAGISEAAQTPDGGAGAYRAALEETLRTARDALEGLPENSVLAAYQRDVIEVYTPLSDEVGTKMEGVPSSDCRILAYRYDLLFLALIVFLFVKTACCDDTALGLIPILRTTRNGRVSLGLGKLLSACAVILAGIVLTAGAEAVSAGGRIAWSGPVQAAAGMTLCPFRMTAFGTLLVSCLFRFLGLTLFAALLMLAEAVIGDFWGTLVCAAGIAGLDAFVSTRTAGSVFGVGNFLGLWRLADGTSWLARLGRAEAGGRLFPALLVPGLLLPLAALTAAAGFLLLCAFPVRLAGRRKKRRSAERGERLADGAGKESPQPLSVPRRLSLMRGEAFKTLFSGRVPVLLWIALILAANAVLTAAAEKAVPFDDRIYARLIAPYTEGAWDGEKSARVAEEAARLDEENARFRNADRDFLAGKLTEEEYREIYATLGGIEVTRAVFRRIEQYAAALDDLTAASGETVKDARGEVSMVYDTGWDRFFSRRPDFLLALAAALAGVSAFAVEYGEGSSSGNMASLIRAAKKGRAPTFGRKAALLVLAVTAFFLVSEGVSVLVLRMRYEFPGADRSLLSLLASHGMGRGRTIGDAALLAETVRYAWALGAAFVSASLTVLTRSFLPALLLLLSAEGLPYALKLPEGADLSLLASGGMSAVTGALRPAAALSVLLLVSFSALAWRKWCT